LLRETISNKRINRLAREKAESVSTFHAKTEEMKGKKKENA